MSATWRANLADAVLLDPLLLLHGNVKDVYTVDEATRARLPVELRDRPTVTFDIWLALEMERQGFDVVCLYDTDGIVVLRRSMLQPFRELMTGRPPLASPGIHKAPKPSSSSSAAASAIAPESPCRNSAAQMPIRPSCGALCLPVTPLRNQCRESVTQNRC